MSVKRGVTETFKLDPGLRMQATLWQTGELELRIEGNRVERPIIHVVVPMTGTEKLEALFSRRAELAVSHDLG